MEPPSAPKDSAPGISLVPDLPATVLPGAVIARLHEVTSGSRAVVRLGPGVLQRGTDVVATKPGAAHLDARRGKVWVSGNQRRYEPAAGDMVVGVVVERHSEQYTLALRGTDVAILPSLAFEGATKRNKPHLVVGNAVYCRVVRAHRNADCEVTCVEPGSSKSWVSAEATFGELKGGNIVSVSLGLARALQARDGTLLAVIGKRIPFESAVGANGFVWVRSDSVENTVLISNAIQKADVMPREKWQNFVARMLRQASK